MVKQTQGLRDYYNSTHRMGRLWTLAALILILLVPFLFCLIYGVDLNWKAFGQGALAILPMYYAVGIIEVFNYAPLLGSGGSYLAFVTGNLMNMKVPAAQMAIEKSGVDAVSEEGEVINTIAVAVSSIVTTLIIAVGMLAIIPMSNWINSVPVLKEVFDLANGYVIPALFGALGVVFLAKGWKLAIVPVVLVTLLFFLWDGAASVSGILIPVASLISVGCGRYMYKKNWM